MNADLFEFVSVGIAGGFGEENRPLGLSPEGFLVDVAFSFDEQEAEALIAGELAEEDIQLDGIVAELDPRSRSKAGGGIDTG